MDRGEDRLSTEELALLETMGILNQAYDETATTRLRSCQATPCRLT